MDTALPLVSVAVISFNQRDFLRECLESILCQSYGALEVVVADDGSSDGSQEMIREMASRDPRVKPVLASKNCGITANSNAALANCSGELVAWMGGDDLMLPGKIAKQVEFFQRHPETALCYHNLDVFDSSSGKTLYYYNGKGGTFPHVGGAEVLVAYGTFCGGCSVMHRRDAAPANGFDARIAISSDWLLWVQIARHGRVGYIDEVLGRYRRHNANVTGRRDDLEESFRTLEIIREELPQYAAAVQTRWKTLVSARRTNRILRGIMRLGVREETLLLLRQLRRRLRWFREARSPGTGSA